MIGTSTTRQWVQLRGVLPSVASPAKRCEFGQPGAVTPVDFVQQGRYAPSLCRQASLHTWARCR